MKPAKIYPHSTAPHWRAEHSSFGRGWVMAGVFFPVVCVSFFVNVRAIPITVFSVAFGLWLDHFWMRLQKRKFEWSGYTVFQCLALSLLVPAQATALTITFGVFLAIFAAKSCFGGQGNHIFQPALIGAAAIWVFCTKHAGNPPQPLFWEPFDGLPYFLSVNGLAVLLIIALGLFAGARRLVPLVISFGFLLTIAFLSAVFQKEILPILFNPGVLICAFFLMTDAPAPVVGQSRFLFGVLTAVLFVFFHSWISLEPALFHAILIMNAVSPILGRHLSPYLLRQNLWVR